jgi:SAM-dependent methyltransferase
MHRDWFETWFDSPYYPILYAHRNNSEADSFIQNIRSVLQIPGNAKVLDLACGQGRHSMALAALGYSVTGADLSRNSIAKAKEHESENLNFVVHDMRRPIAVNYYDAVVNLFTSFGYFESVRDNHRTIDAVHTCLKKEGRFLLDYLNAECVRRIVGNGMQGVYDASGIHFEWQKRIIGDKVMKTIKVNDDGKEFAFTESVSLFSSDDFTRMLQGKFEIIQTFGDYDLSAFSVNSSPRFILNCRKI